MASPATPSGRLATPLAWTPVTRTNLWTASPGRQRRTLLKTSIRRGLIGVCIFVGIVFLNHLVVSHTNRSPRPKHLVQSSSTNSSIVPNAAFQPPEAVAHRASDIIDAFSTYKYRSTCNISSLDLHAAFSPLCSDRKNLLAAMSGGGRIGFEAPYMPRGCDMRWFSTEEICEILGRFEKVIVLGDSMMRHVIGAMNVLLRKDIGYGAVTDWNFSPEERRDCFCNQQFDVKTCSMQGIYKTADVVKNDPDSLACDPAKVDVMIEGMIRFPIEDVELSRLRDDIPASKPKRPYAFVFGHGLWNDLDLQATLDWLDTILDTLVARAPWLAPGQARVSKDATDGKSRGGVRKHERKRATGFFPRLFLTPNAAGKAKPDQWLVSQGNKALQIFEESVKVEVERRGLEHLGTWNMSAQSEKFDGVHLDLKGNMIKAMMVLNWLNMLEVERF